MKLNGKELGRIRVALKAAFPASGGELELVVSDADIGVTFAEFQAPSYDNRIQMLLENAAGKYRLADLLQAAVVRAPGNPELREIAEFVESYFRVLPRLTEVGDAEKVLFANVGFQNVREWIAKLDALTKVVCRIEPQPRAQGIGGYGSGFLVAPDVVLTCEHVVAGFWGDAERAARVRVRFDCVYGADGKATDGVECRLAKDFRIQRDAGLDFALVRLESGSTSGRGVAELSSHAFVEQEPLLILQHPAGEPMKLAFGSVTGKKDWSEDRIAYRVNTNGGSSGSPCLTQGLQVGALHPAGSGAYNRRVPMASIRPRWGAVESVGDHSGREQKYVERLLLRIAKKAEVYSPLEGIGQMTVEPTHAAIWNPWDDDPDLAGLVQEKRAERVRREFPNALAAFQEVRHAAVLGAPGAGKSTTLLSRAADLARKAKEKEGEPIPLLVTLGDWRDSSSLAEFVRRQAPELDGMVDGLAKAGRLTVLLDGLNEMPTAAEVRKQKADAIREWVKELGEQTPVWVSCRLGDYTGVLDLGFDTLTLQELKPWRVREVLRLWVPKDGRSVREADGFFWRLAGDERLAGLLEKWKASGAEEAEGFWLETTRDEEVEERLGWWESRIWKQHVRNPRSLVRLAANPFLLTMLFQVWRGKGELPPNRGSLFQRFVDQLLVREEHRDRSRERSDAERRERREALLTGLTGLAWQMQTSRVAAGPGESGDFSVLTVATRAEAVRALASEEVLKRALGATLLEGEGEVRFRHQLLQEYFTAVALRERMGTMAATELWPEERWWERSGWEEAVKLLAGLYGEDCTEVVRWVGKAQPEVAVECALDAGSKAVGDWGRELKERWLPLLTDSKRLPEPEGRAAIGRALGRLKLDDRKGVGVRRDGVPDIHWVEIPEGSFLYQGKRERMHGFQMARYAVTNAQFEAFVKAKDGYGQDCWWEGMTNPDRELNAAPSWSYANHPRVDVNWWEATAFCAWLSKRVGYEVRLPTEQEWERAASYTDGREYPWGNGYKSGYANISETHYLRKTSAVGMYPDAKSRDGEGVMDLAGNVWEWCLNEFHKPERTQKEGTEPRVLRGGSWINNRSDARAGYRFGDHPSLRLVSVGFRVVCCSPIHGTRGR
ncbi:MAG: SUMF1/EgtB/PvdO family nonheme iron enzyme [Bryobacterales bacterium]|nr:SUMF1/EgtB/PvdO family nonheme iron enzyme [Bryobacterales bacterium]